MKTLLLSAGLFLAASPALAVTGIPAIQIKHIGGPASNSAQVYQFTKPTESNAPSFSRAGEMPTGTIPRIAAQTEARSDGTAPIVKDGSLARTDLEKPGRSSSLLNLFGLLN